MPFKHTDLQALGQARLRCEGTGSQRDAKLAEHRSLQRPQRQTGQTAAEELKEIAGLYGERGRENGGEKRERDFRENFTEKELSPEKLR